VVAVSVKQEVDRFYRYSETLQEFFDESAALETRFVANGE